MLKSCDDSYRSYTLYKLESFFNIIKCRKRQKFAYHILHVKFPVIITMSSSSDIVYNDDREFYV